MKIIISHDVDHLSYGEHWLRDTYIPKYLFRHTRYWSCGSISAALWWQRIVAPLKLEPFNHLDELLTMDRKHGVAATYFIGMRRKLGMSYSHAAARVVIARLLEAGVDVGVHGVEYANAIGIAEEVEALGQWFPVAPPLACAITICAGTKIPCRYRRQPGISLTQAKRVLVPHIRKVEYMSSQSA